MIEIRPLLPTDERKGFHSGHPELDYFFHAFAGQNQFRHYIGITHVAVSDGAIAGYITTSPGHLKRESLPEEATSGKLPHYPIPILRVARLAVDEQFKSEGVGKRLLKHALQSAIAMKDQFGCAGVVVDAKPEAVAFYAKLGFVVCETEAGENWHQPIVMFLGMKKILAAAKQGGAPTLC